MSHKSGLSLWAATEAGENNNHNPKKITWRMATTWSLRHYDHHYPRRKRSVLAAESPPFHKGHGQNSESQVPKPPQAAFLSQTTWRRNSTCSKWMALFGIHLISGRQIVELRDPPGLRSSHAHCQDGRGPRHGDKRWAIAESEVENACGAILLASCVDWIQTNDQASYLPLKSSSQKVPSPKLRE